MMAFSKGFTLLESLVTLIILGVLVMMAGTYWNWGVNGLKEKAYVNAIEGLLSRTKRTAETLEHSIAICFSLSDACVAEGVLYPRNENSESDESQSWQLLAGLPLKDGIFIRTNFKDQQLVVQSGGLSVQHPGTIYICSINKELPYAWSLVVARTGRVTTQKIMGKTFEHICKDID